MGRIQKVIIGLILVIGIQLTLACIAYAVAMSEYAAIPEVMLPDGGGSGRGIVEEVHREGLFQRHYIVRLKGSQYQFRIPPIVLEPGPDESTSRPTPDIPDLLSPGTNVQIQTWPNGDNKITTIMALTVFPPKADPMTVLDFETSRRRVLQAHKNAPQTADHYRSLAWYPLPVALGLCVLLVAGFRRRTEEPISVS